MRRRTVMLGGLLLSGLVFSQVLVPVAVPAAEPPPLIPREVLFGNPEIAGVDLSPDGTRIAYLAPYEGVLNLWVRDLDGREEPRLLTRKTDRPQQGARWTPDGRFLISSRDAQGDENTVLVRIDPRTGETVDLTPPSGVLARVNAADRDVPGELVVGLNDRDPRYHDLYVLDISSGERKLLHQVDDGRPVEVDRLNGEWYPYLRSEELADGGVVYELRLPGEKEWRPFLQFGFEDARLSMPAGFTRDGQWLYGQLSTGEDKPRLVRWSREELERCTTDCGFEVVHRATTGALGIAMKTIETGVPSVLVETDLRSQRFILDPSLRSDYDALERLAGSNEFSVFDRDRKDRLWLVLVSSDRQGEQFWLWDRDRRQHQRLFSVQPKLDDYALASMESLDLKARDGRRIPAYLTRTPLASDGPQPLVLVVHGGPQARDYWGLNRTHQWLANRGYHVMSVNYRGSTGFGKAHLLAGEGEWYARMQDDLVDAVGWAVDQGIADPDKLVIKGASYGGYAALAGLTRDPTLFAAAVSAVGPSNLRTLLESIPPYWAATRINFDRMIGVGSVDLDAISPINHVDQIQRPLLLGHGANDPRVSLRESESIAAAMTARKLPIDFVVFPDEGHGWANPRNALAWAALEEHFLHQHIGGRVEPFGDVLKQCSMDWRLRSLPTP
ncbi:S9 family peptidase [Synechococcus sp. UW105]|uniref:S9 family peptidase n=1 Tax=Synechococcus sp. UW105 TaxID=337067 RepID=UPI000E0EB7F5|nr:S9 family peptidase [Synechococcus sp. UW105]